MHVARADRREPRVEVSSVGASWEGPGAGVVSQGPQDPKIAVVVPCFRAREQVLGVLARIGPECAAVYVVDDACPDGSGKHVQTQCRDPRVRVLFHADNQGVGGATLTGYRAA